MKVAAGTWVQVHQVLLRPGERAAALPPETQGVALELRVKGFLVSPGRLGEPALVETLAGRRLGGTLVAVEPAYDHDFGKPVAELLAIGPAVRRLLGGAP